jgi:hypothetical protein
VPPLMDLIAGDRREILLAIAVEDWDSLADRDRFAAHLALGAGLDPTWLDLFAQAVRRVTGRNDPVDFLDARLELAEGQATERIIESVDGAWLAAVAELRDGQLDAVAGHWIDLIGEELEVVDDEEKPWIRELAAAIVAFSRSAGGARDVLFAWSL